MNDIIIRISKETRMVDVYKSFIGNDGENLQGNLIFEFKDEVVDGVGRIEYEIQGDKKYAMLSKIDNLYIIPIKSVLTVTGQINMQLVITEDDTEEGIPIFKSNVFYIYCNKSINAEIEEPEDYANWIEVANQNMIKMNKIIIEAEQMEREALQLDADVRQLEQDVNSLDLEVDNLTNNVNLIANDIDAHTNEINELENDLDNAIVDIMDLEGSLDHIDDIKANKEEVYTKEQVDDKVKGFATTSSLIAGINGCEPKMPDTVDYIIEAGLYGGGESGYRKYKNGIIEQWGVATTQANETEFTMHKPHIDQKFSIFIEPREIGNFYHYAIPSANQKFKCRIQSRDSISMAIKFQWRSFGRWK